MLSFLVPAWQKPPKKSAQEHQESAEEHQDPVKSSPKGLEVDQKKSKVIRNLLGRSEKQKRQRDPKETPRTPKVMKSSWSPTIFILVFLGKDQETHQKQGYRSNWSVNIGKLICTPVFPQILDTDQVSYWSVPRFCQKIGVQINFLFFSSAPRSAVKSWSVPLFFLKTRVQINLICTPVFLDFSDLGSEKARKEGVQIKLWFNGWSVPLFFSISLICTSKKWVQIRGPLEKQGYRSPKPLNLA